MKAATPLKGSHLVRAAACGALLLLSLLGAGCAQFHLSDGSGGIYAKGNYIITAPLRLISRKPAPEPPLPPAISKYEGTVLFVDKASHRLYLYVNRRLDKAYEVSFGRQVAGHKLFEGDRRTPEGSYRVTVKKNLGQTRFHRALLIDYPNARDRRFYRKAKTMGIVPPGRGIGGLIEVHGGGTGVDWTDGCIALENDDMDEVFERVRVGTPVVIVSDAEGPEAISLPEGLRSP